MGTATLPVGLTPYELRRLSNLVKTATTVLIVSTVVAFEVFKTLFGLLYEDKRKKTLPKILDGTNVILNFGYISFNYLSTLTQSYLYQISHKGLLGVYIFKITEANLFP